MDLRRAIFLKKPLQDSSFNSPNSSCASLYESAAEDSDSSIYYSFSGSPTKSQENYTGDESIKSNEGEEENSVSEEADKENTVVWNDIAEQKKHETENDVPEHEKQDANMPNQPLNETIVIHEDPVIDISSDFSLGEISDDQQMDVDEPGARPAPMVIPEIVVEDPNQNIINPFTLHAPAASSLAMIVEESTPPQHSTPEQKPQQTIDLKKKSASKIPTRSHFYSPVQRKSIDKKTKINFKPPAVPAQKRRTVYEPRSRVIEKPKPSVAPVNVVQPMPKVTKVAAPKPQIKPVLYKCTFTGCNREFRLQKTYQDHKKFHNNSATTSSSTSASSTVCKCEWCDKKFDLDSALIGHKLEKCPKIPFNEKRKLIEQEEKRVKTTDKRKSMFAAPAPKKRSPSRRKTLNKSGVTITPKKTLKCHGCGKLFTDVLEFANHTVSAAREETLVDND
jgi:hypothetical protein